MANAFHLKHWLRLSLARGVGGKTLRALLAAYDSPGAALAAPESALRRHVSANIARALRDEDATAEAVAAALKWQQEDGNAILTLADSLYPAALLETADPPALLYARGDLALLQKPMVAIVGSRSASAAGARNTEIFARALSEAGCVVVSGMAHGIDAAAHKGALDGGTIAVMGTGADIIYPRDNRALAADICARGLLLSEFALGTRPLSGNFPRRNRVISGIARACLVVEATLNSGSLITARLAAEQGREVFAVPGSINSPLHRGCHQLIKQGATLAENVTDVLDALNLPLPASPRHARRGDDNIAAGVDSAGGDVLPYIGYQPTSVDDIVVRSGIAADSLMPALLELEMAGKIVSSVGGCFQRV